MYSFVLADGFLGHWVSPVTYFHEFMASKPSSSAIDDCINKAADFLLTCDNVQRREGCVSILLEVLSNSLITSRVSPRTLQKLVSADDRLRRHIQRAVIVSRTPPSPQLNLRELSQLVEAVSPPDSILVIRRLDRLKGDMHALQQAIMVDPQDVIMWPAPPRGSAGSHKLPGMAFLTCLKGRDSAEEILRCCGGLISIKRSDGVTVELSVQKYKYHERKGNASDVSQLP